MLFAEALELLKVGKCVCRDGWVEQEGYIVLLQGMKHAWKIITSPAPNAGNHIFSVAELAADDWVEYNESKFAPKAAESVPDAA